jgi:hypothetical protein
MGETQQAVKRVDGLAYGQERIALIRKGWTVRTETIGVCVLVRHGERRVLIVTRKA